MFAIISSLIPYRTLILYGGIALALVTGYLYIQKLQAERDLAVVEKTAAQEAVKRIAQINADNLKAFKDFQASMTLALSVAKEAADFERQRNEDLNTFIEDLQNVQDTDACINSEPVRRALEWLRNQPSGATD